MGWCNSSDWSRKFGSFKILVKDINQNFVLYPRDKSIFINSPIIVTGNLVINEFCADNDNVIADSAGDYDDWIEIFNPTTESVSLSGMYLTDKPNNLTKWQFPENINIAAGEYLLIWCDEQQEQGPLHTNFALSANGEFIGLTSSDGITVIDSITFGPQTTDISYGRFPDASLNWQLFNQPTPGTSNNPTGVKENSVPLNFELTAYPNPFNPSTKIRFVIPQSSFVSLKVYNILGKEIQTLVNEEKSVGSYEVEFKALNLSSGVYFYRIDAGRYSVVKKLLLLK